MEEVITTKQFSKTLMGCEIHFYILRMKQSVLVWIGRISSFKHLSVAMKSRLVGNNYMLHAVMAICVPIKSTLPLLHFTHIHIEYLGFP